MRFLSRPRQLKLTATNPVILQGRNLTQTIITLTLFEPLAVAHWIQSISLQGRQRLAHPLLFLFGGWKLNNLLKNLRLNEEEIKTAHSLILDYFVQDERKSSLSEAIVMQKNKLDIEVNELVAEERALRDTQREKQEALLHVKIVLVEELIGVSEQLSQVHKVMTDRNRTQEGLRFLRELLERQEEGVPVAEAMESTTAI